VPRTKNGQTVVTATLGKPATADRAPTARSSRPRNIQKKKPRAKRKPIPHTTIGVRLPDTLLVQTDRIAEYFNVAIAAVIRRALEDAVRTYGPQAGLTPTPTPPNPFAEIPEPALSMLTAPPYLIAAPSMEAVAHDLGSRPRVPRGLILPQGGLPLSAAPSLYSETPDLESPLPTAADQSEPADE
jgi:hypothetical protein